MKTFLAPPTRNTTFTHLWFITSAVKWQIVSERKFKKATNSTGIPCNMATFITCTKIIEQHALQAGYRSYKTYNSCPLPCSRTSEVVFSVPCHIGATCGQHQPRCGLGMGLLQKELHPWPSCGPDPNACSRHSLCPKTLYLLAIYIYSTDTTGTERHSKHDQLTHWNHITSLV